MKSSLYLLFATLIGFQSLPAQTQKPLPKDAEALRLSYLRARIQALEPIDRKYANALENLLSAHTRAGQLDDALAIKAELEALKAKKPSEPSPSDIRELIVGSVWRQDAAKTKTITFIDKTTCEFRDSANGSELTMPYHFEGEILYLIWSSRPGEKKACVISPDQDSFLEAGRDTWRRVPPPVSSAPVDAEHPQALIGKSFQFIRRGSITLLTFGEDGKVQGNDHLNEALWSVSQKGILQFKHPTGVVTSVFDKKKIKDGLLRFEGTAMLDAKKKLNIEHVLQEVRK